MSDSYKDSIKRFYTKLNLFYKELLIEGNEELRLRVNTLYNEWSHKNNINKLCISKEAYILSHIKT